MAERLQAWRRRLDFGASPYVLLSIRRLRLLDARARSGKPLDKSNHLANNLTTRFDLIQKKGRALLAESCGLDVSKLDWRRGTLHDLRRSFITHQIRAGVDILSLCKMVGQSPDVMLRHYHETLDEVRDLVRTTADSLVGSRQNDRKMYGKPELDTAKAAEVA